ncbi:unnamed protein product [Adineta steineri]|uniref:Reverse transcriptase domain-containing protein n=1 Tax=Adineta steineri TaxID=433720 RepID=A0A819SPE1_9BILA|nr:unnamed protein product [Adineta steineri]
MKKYRIQIAALSETCIYDSGVKLINDYSLIYSGLPSTNKTRNAHGVALLLDESATKVWKNSGAEWEAISERIIKIRLVCTPINITIISVYSPINPVNKQMTEASEKFYNDLQDTVNKISTDDMIIIMGDLNARVEGGQGLPTINNCVGPFTVDSVNENGTKLTDFCMINNIIIANTFFEHKPVHQMSWMHPSSKVWHMLDYTLVNKKYRSSIEDVRMFRRAAGAIGTDHHLMRIKIKLHLKTRRKLQVRRTKYDYTKFKSEKALAMFQKDLNETLSDVTESVKENAEKHFKLDKNNSKRKEWLTDEILQIVEQKSTAFINWQNHRGDKSEAIFRNKYKRLRKLVKTKIDARQVEYWDEICEEIEKNIKLNNPSAAFSIIRRLRGGRKSVENMPIRDKNGMLLVTSSDRLRRWREFFNELLNVPQTLNSDLINEISTSSLSKVEEERQNAVPSIEEIRKALGQMKSKKAPGHDEITADILKAGGEPICRWLYEIFAEVWNKEEMVEDWSVAILIRLFKKGDKQLCDNYRGISLLSVISKLFSRIILNRIQQLIDNQLLEAQSGFRPNRSTIDHIFILKMIMERRKEFNKPLFLCFIDITKAYDSVNRNLLWKVCRKYGISEKLVNLLKMLYKNSKAKVRIEGEVSDSFLIETGVLQGGIPSPILFNLLFDFIIRKVIDQAGASGVQFVYGSNDFYHGPRENYDKCDILNLLYADDLVVMCETTNDLEIFINTFEIITQEYGLVMSVKKTCIMTLQQYEEDQMRKVLKNLEVNHPIIDLNIRNQKIDNVDSFTRRTNRGRNRQRSCPNSNSVGNSRGPLGPNIINQIPHIQLNEDEYHILRLGPRFIFNDPKIASRRRTKELSKLRRKLESRFHGKKVNPSRPVQEFMNELDLILQNHHYIHTNFRLPIPKKRNYLRIVKRLKHKFRLSNVILRKTDKSKVFHLGTLEHYQERSDEYMDRTQAYQCIGTNDPLLDLIQRTNKHLLDLRLAKSLTQKQYEQLCVQIDEAELARLYYLPKAHKPTTPLRPIIFGLKHPTLKISKFLDGILRPLFDRMAVNRTVSNGFELLKKLQQWSSINIKQETVLCTIDVTDLYTMIPQVEGVLSLKQMLDYLDLNQVNDLKTEVIIQLASFVMNNNYFKYNGQYYHQIRGGAMGSPITLTIANCYMFFYEQQICKQITNSFGLYVRYIDDIFIIINWPSRYFLKQVDRWNEIDSNIKLSANINLYADFLDLHMENKDGILRTSVYHKPSYEPYCLPFHSIHPLHMKQNIPFTMLFRGIRYCSTFQSYLQERDHLRMALLLNQYPIKFIDQQFNRVLEKFNVLQPLTSTNYNTIRLQITDSPIKVKEPTNYGRSMFVHFTYCFSMKSFPQKFHQLWNKYFFESPINDITPMLGTINADNLQRRLVQTRDS